MVHATNVVGNNSNSRVAANECDSLIISKVSSIMVCIRMYYFLEIRVFLMEKTIAGKIFFNWVGTMVKFMIALS